jgi:hypothetical protein
LSEVIGREVTVFRTKLLVLLASIAAALTAANLGGPGGGP